MLSMFHFLLFGSASFWGQKMYLASNYLRKISNFKFLPCFFLLYFTLSPVRAQSDTLSRPGDSLYIIINNKRAAILAAKDTAALAPYLNSGAYRTDSIIKDSNFYKLYLSPRPIAIDSVVLAVHPPLPRNIEKYISSRFPRDYLSLVSFVEKVQGLTVNETALMVINGKRTAFIKGQYHPPAGSFALQLWPVNNGKWQLTGQGRLQSAHFLSKSGTMEWAFESNQDNRTIRYRHDFPFVGGTPWGHHYRFSMRKTGESRLSMTHSLYFNYRYGALKTGMGTVWQETVTDSLRLSQLYLTGIVETERHPLFIQLRGGLTGRQNYFGALSSRWNGGIHRYGLHYFNIFISSDSSLVQNAWPARALWLRNLVPASYRSKGWAEIYSQYFPLETNDFLYVFQHIYAIREENRSLYTIFTIGMGMHKRSRKQGFDIEVFYPYYTSYETDLKEVMFSFRWSGYW